MLIAGVVAQILHKGGIRTLRTLARACTDSMVRQGQGKVAAESLKQMKEVCIFCTQGGMLVLRLALCTQGGRQVSRDSDMLEAMWIS